ILQGGGQRGTIYGRLRDLRDHYGELVRARFPRIPRRVSGYNLDELLPENGFHVARSLVGTEGTCVTSLEAPLQLVHSPPARALLVLGYPDIYRAGDDVMPLLDHRPIGLEGFDAHLVDSLRRKGMNPANIALLPEGRGWLLVEFGAETMDEAKNAAEGAMAMLRRSGGVPDMRLLDDPHQAEKVWRFPESRLRAPTPIP